MAMPLLKDYLPPEEEPANSRSHAASGALSAQLDEHEAKLVRAEMRAVALREAIERFVAAVRGSLPHLTENDLFQVYQQIDAEDQANRPVLTEHVRSVQERRARVTRSKDGMARQRALQLYDREIRMLKLALAGFEWGKEQAEALRDAILVRDAQQFSSPAFWGDDD